VLRLPSSVSHGVRVFQVRGLVSFRYGRINFRLEMLPQMTSRLRYRILVPISLFISAFVLVEPLMAQENHKSAELPSMESRRQEVAGAQFKSWEMPVNQINGAHLELPELVTLTPFKAASDYQKYVARLHQVPRMFDQLVTNMRQGMRDELMPPRYLLEKVSVRAQEIANMKAEDSPFAGPLK